MNNYKYIDQYYYLFVCIVFFILLLGLGSYGLAETSEARYAEISREMFLSGDYIHPTLLQIYHYHKPPITYYITSLGYKIFGTNEFGARFFLQLAFVIQLILVYRITILLYANKSIAFAAGLIYFSLPIVLISTRNLTTDGYFTTFIMIAIYAWLLYSYKKRAILLYGFYIAFSFALLTKGPVAILFISIYIIAHKILLKRKTKLTMHHVVGFLVFIAISASWYIIVIKENPQLWNYFTQKQLVSRVNSNSFNRAKPFWYYIPIVVALLAPWIIAITPNLKSQFRLFKNRSATTKILFYSAFSCIVLFSAFSTKLILYLLPMFWMIAILIAVGCHSFTGERFRSISSIVYVALFGILFIGLAGIHFLPQELIQISMETMLIALATLVIFLIAYAVVDYHNKLKPAILAAIFGGSVVLISTSAMIQNSVVINSTKDMVRFIDTVSKDKNNEIIVYDYLLSSIAFYSNDDLITLRYKHDTSQREVQFQQDNTWQDHLWDVEDPSTIRKIQTLKNKKHLFILVRNKQEMQSKLTSFEKQFNHHKNYPKWTIHYNI